jgi:hypothetical protein
VGSRSSNPSHPSLSCGWGWLQLPASKALASVLRGHKHHDSSGPKGGGGGGKGPSRRGSEMEGTQADDSKGSARQVRRGGGERGGEDQKGDCEEESV